MTFEELAAQIRRDVIQARMARMPLPAPPAPQPAPAAKAAPVKKKHKSRGVRKHKRPDKVAVSV